MHLALLEDPAPSTWDTAIQPSSGTCDVQITLRFFADLTKTYDMVMFHPL
jgi:hypothetical protein